MIAGDPHLLRAGSLQAPFTGDGMTLVEPTALMTRLGVTDAMNLDGGGSTTMVVNGRYVNRPSDATGERPVSNALAVVGPSVTSCR